MGCDLDRPYAEPPLTYVALGVVGSGGIPEGGIGVDPADHLSAAELQEAAEHVARICAEVADTTAPVHVEGADRSLPWPPIRALPDFEPDDRAA